VSSRYDDRDVLPEEDDWFADPPPAPWDPPSLEEQEWPGEYEPPPPPREPRADSRRVGLVVAGVTVAIAVFAVGVLIVRVIGDGSEATPTVATTPTTVPDTTLPDATTPDTTVDTTAGGTTPDTTTPTGAGVLPVDVTLRPGDSGDNVIALQEALSQAGYDPGAIDGDYGPATTQAVAAFQTAEGLSTDGVAGPETLTALNAASTTG
jgi:Putative peptidoglycan binding domain